MEPVPLGQVQNTEAPHRHAQRFTCKKDVGGAGFGLVLPADVALAELSPAAKLARVRGRGVDQSQLAIALVLPHAVNGSEASSRGGAPSRCSPLCCSPPQIPLALRAGLSQAAQTSNSMFAGKVCGRVGGGQREKLLKGHDVYIL